MARSNNNRSARARDNGATLGFEAKLWQAADALRNNMDAAEYKHVVLGLIFLKYISDAFEAKHAELDAAEGEGRRPGGPRRVPRREHLLGAAGGPLVAPEGAAPRSRRSARLVDDAMTAIERDNPSLKGVLAEGLRPPRPRQAAARPAHRPDQRHRPRQRGRSRQGHPRPRLRVFPRPIRQRRGQEAAASSTRRRASCACWSRCSRRTRAASTTLLRLRRDVRQSARSSSRRTAARSATSRSTARSRTTRPGGSPR